jgi:hypothetical protein
MWASSVLYWNLFGVYPADALVLSLAEVGLALLVTASCAAPIIRGMRQNPVIALR